MRKRTIAVAAGTLGVAGVAAWLLSTSRAFTQRVPYEVLEHDGRFEIRSYAAIPVAVAEMSGEKGNDAFGRLFRFIAGGNSRQQKLSMTSPVFIDRRAGHAPGHGTMSFALPADAAYNPPAPAEGMVKLERRPAAKMAVVRFSGGMNRNSESEAEEQLRAWVRNRGLTSHGEPVVAYYDSPFIPPFLKRNEVMLPLDVQAGHL